MEYTEDADRRELLLHSAYDSDTVRAMERPLLDKGVPLMRMAAQAAAHMAAGMLDDEDLALEDTSIVLLAGAGDNGGDGLFAAAALAQEGANVTAIAVGRSLHEAGFASFVRAGGKVLVLDPAADIPGCASGFSAGEAGERLQTAIAVARKSHLIIDAMTGIGIQGSLRGIPAALASALGLDGEAPDEPALPNRESSGDFPLVLAVDTPSGVGVNDGSLPGPYIPATVTVTFGAMKPCAVIAAREGRPGAPPPPRSPAAVSSCSISDSISTTRIRTSRWWIIRSRPTRSVSPGSRIPNTPGAWLVW